MNVAAAARQDELLAEYLSFCARAGMEPVYCFDCGEYRPLLVDGSRPPRGCGAPAVRRHLGSVTVPGPWGTER